MDWYRTMSDMRDDAMGLHTDSGVIHSTPITRKVLYVLVAILALALTNHVARLYMGKVSWLGFVEADVSHAPEWSETPFSTNAMSSSAAAYLPIYVLEGQDFVIRYRVSAKGTSSTTPGVHVLVSCFCPATSWQHFRIKGSGSGELVMRAKTSWFYSVRIWQSPGTNRTPSHGMYWFGVRRARTPSKP